MAMIVLRLGYACATRRRGEVVAALRAIDAIGAPAGWPAGRYLLVDTRGAGEPDLEVEYTFTSLADMEQREARLREQLRANARDGGPDTASWQSGLISPGTRRLLTLVDDPGASRMGRRSVQDGQVDAPATHSTQRGVGPPPPTGPSTAVPRPVEVSPEKEEDGDEDTEPDEEPIEIDPSSLIPEGELPAPLPADEQRARARSLVREVPGLRVGFGDTELTKAPSPERRPPRRDD
jgi:hypothetical protein